MAKQTLDLTILASTSNNMAASFNSPAIDVSKYYTYSIQYIMTTGDAVGTLKVQVSDDNTNFTDYPESSKSVDAASSTNDLWEVIVVGHKYVRIAYTKTSGTTGAFSLIGHLVIES